MRESSQEGRAIGIDSFDELGALEMDLFLTVGRNQQTGRSAKKWSAYCHHIVW
jgi:hypothetical protein